jgi:hypothetical protein
MSMFRERLMRHPAWLVLVPTMRVSQKVSPQQKLLKECLNITIPDDPCVLNKLFDLTASCVVCGDPIHPVTPDSETDLSVRFTCDKVSCLTDLEIVHLTDSIIGMMSETYNPHQTLLF